MDAIEPILTFDAEDNGGLLVFRTPDEIREWVEQEKKFWGWFIATRNQDGNLNEPSEALRRLWEATSNSTSEFERSLSNPAAAKQHLNRLADQWKQTITTRRVLISSSAAGAFLNKLKDRGPKIAAYAYVALTSYTIPLPSSTESYEGFYEGLLFKKSIRGVADAERATLEQLKDAFQKEQQALLTSQKDLLSTQTTLQKETTDLIAKHGNNHETLCKDHQSSFDKQLKETKEELTNLKKAYEEHMSLKAPVKYWETRSYFQILFAVLWVGLLISLTAVVLQYDEANIEKLLVADKLSIPRVGYALLVITLFFWAVRILVRLFLSNVHGFNHARERAIMVKTYLSLITDGVAVKAEDRVFLLKSLFRPSSTGLIKDDAIPPILEAIGQATKLGR